MGEEYIYKLGWTRCPCSCGGEGLVIIVSCPTCHSLFGICDEIDSFISDIRNLVEGGIAYGDDAPDCPSCGSVSVETFQRATFSEILAAGFTQDDIFRMPRPFGGTTVPMARTPVRFRDRPKA